MCDCMTQEDAMNMSNEQAIQILKPFRDMMIDQYGCPISSAVFALDKAIEALKSEPCEDAVSREALRKAMYHRAFETDGDTMWQSGCWIRYRAVEQVIKESPSVTPKQKTGEWNGYNADNPDWLRDDGSPVFLTCSECHGAVMNNGSAHWNFCPNCGARMTEEDV